MGAKHTNGGIVKFTKKNTQIETKGNTVVFINDGDGSVGYALYKLDSFIGTVNIAAAYSEKINPYTGIFVATSANMLRSKYSFGYKRTLTHLKQDRIMLPKSANNQPNWDYMEQYIVNIMKTIEVPKLKPIKSSSIALHSVKWHEFKISDVMNVLSGVRLTSSDMRQGNIPFIGASDSNNGITNWTSDTNSSTDNNVLGINYNGSVGEVFYHPYVATFSDDVKRLKLKQTTRASKEVYLFIKTMLLQQKSKYAYGYKFNGTRMKAQKIMLPVNDEGTLNWQFMEEYINSISNSRLL